MKKILVVMLMLCLPAVSAAGFDWITGNFWTELFTVCPSPYHILDGNGTCLWSCAEGTTPEMDSFECQCKTGYIEVGTDQLDRRVCAIKCTNGDMQKCNGGVQICRNNVWSHCMVEKCVTEICDGKDNDCDGKVDEMTTTDPNNCGKCGNVCNLPHVASHRCQDSECKILTCDSGFDDLDGDSTTGCESSCTPSNKGIEICDGEDNDCDGRIDENLPDLTSGNDTGECRTEVKRCAGGYYQVIRSKRVAQPEICDGKDNDCDRTVDEGCASNDECDEASDCPKQDIPVCKYDMPCVKSTTWECVNPDGISKCEATGTKTECVTEKCDVLCLAGICIECTLPGDCPEQKETFCSDGNLCVQSTVWKCDKPGTVNAKCIASGIQTECDPCALGYECKDDACVGQTCRLEVCDGKDNDCDGTVDEMKATDVNNCGRCGNVCNLPHVRDHSCVKGDCMILNCDISRYDINKVPDDGCEMECRPSNKGIEICDYLDNNCDGTVDEGCASNDECDEASDCPKQDIPVCKYDMPCVKSTTWECVNPDGISKCEATGTETECVTEKCDVLCLAGICIECTLPGDCPEQKETFCSDGNLCVQSTVWKCDKPGTVDAKCIASGIQTVCAMCPLGYRCEVGKCLEHSRTCTDSDGGRNFYKKGCATGIMYDGTSRTNVCDQCQIYTDNVQIDVDSCTGEDCIVAEWNCHEGELQIDYNSRCPQGCYYGACEDPEPTTECKDEDNADIFVVGAITGKLNPKKDYDYRTSDYCLNLNILREFYCLDDKYYDYMDVECPDGCFNDKCYNSHNLFVKISDPTYENIYCYTEDPNNHEGLSGTNIFTKKNSDGSIDIKIKKDVCVDGNEPVERGKDLMEHTCFIKDSRVVSGMTRITCEHGCMFGACSKLLCFDEVCNGWDDDCDGVVDNGYTVDNCKYVCEDMGGVDFNTDRPDGLKCCGDNATWEPNLIQDYQTIETLCDNMDNDCDGMVDEGCTEVDEPVYIKRVWVEKDPINDDYYELYIQILHPDGKPAKLPEGYEVHLTLLTPVGSVSTFEIGHNTKKFDYHNKYYWGLSLAKCGLHEYEINVYKDGKKIAVKRGDLDINCDWLTKPYKCTLGDTDCDGLISIEELMFANSDWDIGRMSRKERDEVEDHWWVGQPI